MFVDASALVAILLEEPDHPVFAAALEQSVGSLITPFVLMAAGLAAMRETSRRADDVHAEVDGVLRHFHVSTVD
ncbi:MAG: hypothetical protein ACRC7C_05610, partial [Beijerinckiaceae bacterium]